MRQRNNEGKFTHQIFKDRMCYVCGSNKTYVDKTGRHHWANVDGEWFCKLHYQRYFDNPRRNPENSKKWNPITHAKYGPRRMTYEGERIYRDKNYRVGECFKCGKSVGDEYIDCVDETAIIKRTHGHHEYGYFIIFKWFGLVEYCARCHGKEPKRKRSPNMTTMKKIKGKWMCFCA